MEFKIKDAFVCNFCREKCGGPCNQEILDILNGRKENNDLYPRKQIISCLGQYCDKPCELQKDKSDLTIDQCVLLIKYLGQKLNDVLTNPNH